MDVSGEAACAVWMLLCYDSKCVCLILYTHDKYLWGFVLIARRPGVMEVMHNLDYCDILVIGEELNPDRESLEIHHSALLGKHLDATNSTSGISIYGRTY